MNESIHSQMNDTNTSLDHFILQHLNSPVFILGDIPNRLLAKINSLSMVIQTTDEDTYPCIFSWEKLQKNWVNWIDHLKHMMTCLKPEGKLILAYSFPYPHKQIQRKQLGLIRYDMPHELSQVFKQCHVSEFEYDHTLVVCIVATALKKPLGVELVSKSFNWYSFLTVFDDANQDIAPPSFITIETTTHCNLRCRTCSKRYTHEPGKHFPFEHFVTIARTCFPYAKTVNLTGVGEPLVHPQVNDMLDLIQANHCKIDLITNGVLLKPDLCKKICQIGGNVTISIDGATPETYEFIRPESKWSLMMKRLENLARIKQEVGNPNFCMSINFVAVRHNITDLPQMVDMCKMYGAKILTVIEMQNWVHNEAFYRKQALCFYPKLANEVYKTARKRADELGIVLNLPSMYTLSADSTEDELKLTNSTQPAHGISTIKTYLRRHIPENSLLRKGYRKIKQTDFVKHLSMVFNPIPHVFSSYNDDSLSHGGSAYVCQLPWYGIFFDVNGNVLNCCALRNVVFGNINDHNPMDVWKGGGFIRHRIYSRLGYPPPLCFHCPLFYGITQGNPVAKPPQRKNAPELHISLSTDMFSSQSRIDVSIQRILKEESIEWKTYLLVLGPQHATENHVVFLTETDASHLSWTNELKPWDGKDGVYQFALPEPFAREQGLYQLAGAIVPKNADIHLGFWIYPSWQTDSVFFRITNE
ncbi:MAG: radical SAM protein [Desulfobacterales bacterium]|nr:radical SAM protein [Desulfobacterales bacterium]